MPIRIAIVEGRDKSLEHLLRLVEKTRGLKSVGVFGPYLKQSARCAAASADVVLLDMEGTQLSAAELLRRIRMRYPGAEVLLTVSGEDDNLIFDALSAGASGCVFRDAPARKILDAIRDVRAGGVPMTPKTARKMLRWFRGGAWMASGDYRLSGREREILDGLVAGMSYKMIAEKYTISIDTVRSHIKHLYEKLHVHSKSEAVAKALRGTPD